MFIGIDQDIRFLGQTVSPLMFDIFDDAPRKFVSPARIDGKRPADARIDKVALACQTCFLKELTSRSLTMRFIVFKTTGDGLPEIKRAAAPQQKDIASVAVNDDEN